MAYDRVKQTHPGAPAAVGARVRHAPSGRLGSIAPPRAGLCGIGVRFDGQFGVVDCDPLTLAYAAGPPQAAEPWCAR